MFDIKAEFKENAQLIINLIKGFEFVRKMEVVVGITEESNAARENGMTNSQLLYMHENGVPSHNIPPRPVLKPAISEDGTREKIEQLMKEGMESAIVRGDVEKARQDYEKAGMVGRDACRAYILASKVAPNAESTIRRKHSSIPLVDKASMLGSINYAVRRKK